MLDIDMFFYNMVLVLLLKYRIWILPPPTGVKNLLAQHCGFRETGNTLRQKYTFSALSSLIHILINSCSWIFSFTDCILALVIHNLSLFPNRFLPVFPSLQTLEFVLIWLLPEVWEWEQRPLFEITRSNGGQANRGSKHVFPGTEEEPLPLISTFLWTGWWTAARCFGSVFTLPQGSFSGILYTLT